MSKTGGKYEMTFISLDDIFLEIDIIVIYKIYIFLYSIKFYKEFTKIFNDKYGRIC